MLNSIILGSTVLIIVIVLVIAHGIKKIQFDPMQFMLVAFSCVYIPIGLVFLSYAIFHYPDIVLSEFTVEIFFSSFAFLAVGIQKILEYCN